MTKEDVDFIILRLRKAIELTMDDLKAEGIMTA